MNVTRRTNPLIILGAVILVVGALAVAFASRDDDGAASAEVPVLRAGAEIRPGTEGDDLLDQGVVTVARVDRDQRPADALTDPTQLRGRVFESGVEQGAELRSSQLRPRTARGTAIDIPDGKQGVAVSLGFVSAGAGYVGAGDRVNLYGNVADDGGGFTRLLLSNVEVLDVSTEVAPRRTAAPTSIVPNGQAASRATSQNVTLLLALDPIEAERVIFLTANHQLWVALADTDAAPAGPTPGRRLDDVFNG